MSARVLKTNSKERQDIIDFLAKRPEPTKTSQLAAGLRKEYRTVANILTRMVRDGQLIRPRYGHYSQSV